MIALIAYIFISKPGNPIPIVGTVVFISGIMMGFTSLSDTATLTKKEKKDLANPKAVKIQYISLFTAATIVVFVSTLFLSVKFIFPEASKSFIKDFSKLGYDCLVLLLGILCLIKQHAEKVNYVKNLNS
jgi:hypothetical protein